MAKWQQFYNEQRSHGSLKGKTPAAQLAELTATAPAAKTIQVAYDPEKEVYKTNNRYG